MRRISAAVKDHPAAHSGLAVGCPLPVTQGLLPFVARERARLAGVLAEAERVLAHEHAVDVVHAFHDL